MTMILSELLRAQPSSLPAIRAAGRSDLTYARLLALAERVDGELSAAGVPGGARIATVLRNGPEAASAFIALACRGAVAPLNPALTEAELAYVLGDLKPRLLVAGAETGPAVAAAAQSLGIPVARLTADESQPAGWFGIEGLGHGADTATPVAINPGDEILLLHTSGTTAKPKLVPITQGAFCASAQNVAATLELTAADISLNVMPLFHVHGLVASLVAQLSVGGSVWCSPGFSALHFQRWLEESGATWYSAVPSMHQAIVKRAGYAHNGAPRHSLRLIRSCSAPLMDQTWRDLERVFQVPVVQAYGMTEAAHQVSSTRPGETATAIGTVGRSSGPEIRIVDGDGRELPLLSEGEVALRGDTLLTGYLSPPGANECAFRNGFFLTGDIGLIDSQGNLKLTGRRKEMINCGGEKLSPYEIEEALAALAGVQQAVVFAVPHPSLGEEPCAALAAEAGSHVDVAQIRAALKQRLSLRKVPRRYWVVDAIPSGPTGKLQRSRMADLLASAGVAPLDSGSE